MQWVACLRGVRVSFGAISVLDEVSLAVPQGARVGVVGRNGSGKSTLLRVLAGRQPPSEGEAQTAAGITTGLFDQEPALDDGLTVLETIRTGAAETLAALTRFEQAADRLAADYSDELMRTLGELQEQLDQQSAWDLDSRLEQAMAALRCPPPRRWIASLSGGECRRVALCRLLVQQPELLLLDEPTNHLDTESVQWLEQDLAGYPGTVVAATHDRYFLDNVAQWVVEVDRGRVHLHKGNYSAFLQARLERIRIEGLRDEKRRRRLADELAWLRAGGTEHQARARKRLDRYEQLAADAARRHHLDADEIHIPPGPRLGTLVLEVEHLEKRHGKRLLFDDVSFTLPRNGVVGVLGPNGIGKTTLFNLIAGRQRPDAGTIRIGDSVRLAYADQARAAIATEKPAWGAVADGAERLRIGPVEIPARAYLAAFGITGADQDRPARLFSGGDRNRLNLALALSRGGNLLLLDEPTNDLDVDTLGSLERALLEFPGCALISAHDRWFLDRVATHILAWEGTDADPGRWFWFEGNYETYRLNKQRRIRAGAELTGPSVHRRLARD